MYQIYNKDCFAVMQRMADNGEKVDCIITDPPYLYLNHKLDRKFNEELFFELASKITDKILFFGRGDSFYKWNLICADLGFEFKEEIVWDKKATTSPMLPIGRCHETISIRMKKGCGVNKIKMDYVKTFLNSRDFKKVFTDLKRVASAHPALLEMWAKGEKRIVTKKTKHGITSQDCLDIDRGQRTLENMQNGIIPKSIITINREHYKMEHPTQKPIELMRILIKIMCDKNQVVFDPFMGSGSTGVACMIENRRFIGSEIDKEYFDIAERRVGETDRTMKQSLFYGMDW